MRILILLLLVSLAGGAAYAGQGVRVTNEMIYQKLLEIEKRQAVLEAELREFKEATNKRFQDMNRRFEDLREDMNRRFEQVDKRFEEQRGFMEILAGIFTALVAAVIALVIWDRRTAVRVAIKEASREMEKEYGLSNLKKILEALREKAQTDKELAAILRNYGLL